MLSTTGAIYGQGKGEKVALITDEDFLAQQEVFVLDMLVRSSIRRTNSLIKKWRCNRYRCKKREQLTLD